MVKVSLFPSRTASLCLATIRKKSSHYPYLSVCDMFVANLQEQLCCASISVVFVVNCFSRAEYISGLALIALHVTAFGAECLDLASSTDARDEPSLGLVTGTVGPIWLVYALTTRHNAALRDPGPLLSLLVGSFLTLGERYMTQSPPRRKQQLYPTLAAIAAAMAAMAATVLGRVGSSTITTVLTSAILQASLARYLMSAFPNSLLPGESSLLAAAVVLVVVNVAVVPPPPPGHRLFSMDELSSACVTPFLHWVAWVLIYGALYSGIDTKKKKNEGTTKLPSFHSLVRSTVIHPCKYVTGAFLVGWLLASLGTFSLMLGQSLLSLLFRKEGRLTPTVKWILYWVIVVVITASLVLQQLKRHKAGIIARRPRRGSRSSSSSTVTKHDRWRAIMVRKLFHAAAGAIYVPPILLATPSLSDESTYGVILLAATSAAAFALLVLVEFLRIAAQTAHRGTFPNVAHEWTTRRFFGVFTDKRDHGTLIFTHMTLLVGCSVTVWVEVVLGARLDLHGGSAGVGGIDAWRVGPVLCLSVLDVLSALVGARIGSRQVGASSSKTWEGVIAGIGGSLLLSFILAWYRRWGATVVVRMALALIAASWLEGSTHCLDNLVVPVLWAAVFALRWW